MVFIVIRLCKSLVPRLDIQKYMIRQWALEIIISSGTMYCCHIKLNHYSVSRVQNNFCLRVLSSETVRNSDHLGYCRSGIGNCSGNNWLIKLLPLSGNYSLSVLLVFSHEPILEFIILQAMLSETCQHFFPLIF